MKKMTVKTTKGSSLTLSITKDKKALIEVGTHSFIADYILFAKGLIRLGRVNHKPAFAGIPENESHKIEAFKVELQKAKDEQNKKDYAFLMEKLPERVIGGGFGDNEKTKQLIALAKKQTFYSSDPENEGLNLAVQAHKERLTAEAHKHCSHDFETTFSYNLTLDSRKKLIRTSECKHCSKTAINSVSEDISESGMLS